MTQNLLVLTALEDTWGNGQEKLIFLGEWCKKIERKHILEKRNHKTIAFHWDNRVKVKSDYDYLELLHHRLLKSLSKYLNNLHGVNYSERYWQIILDPWLLSYVGVLFDRWETLRIAFETQDLNEVIFLCDRNFNNDYLCWNEFMKLVVDDCWNQSIYQRIIISEYKDKIFVKYKKPSDFEGSKPFLRKNKLSIKIIFKSCLSNLIRFIDQVFGVISRKNKIIFVGSFFNLTALIKLNFSIGQIPRLYLNDFPVFEKKPIIDNNEIIKNNRNDLKFHFKSNNKFEQFINNWIIKDLPKSLIEYYFSLNSKALKVKIYPKIIITANPHWGNIIAKFWFASQINLGTKLVVLEHGGSLPAYKELFNFEEDIADSRGTWFLPYHSKHFQLPPSKVVSHKIYNLKTNSLKSREKKNKGYLCIVSSEHARYVYRLHFYPMAQQCLTSLDLIIDFYNNLQGKIQQVSRLKAYLNQGWNTRLRFSKIMGSEKIMKTENLKQAMEFAHIIVCSYPETTFSEAMATGIPTILLYPDYLYERNPISFPLIKILKSAKIIFNNSEDAAEHINLIWDNPDKWWRSNEVLKAREEFYKQALKINSNWIYDWKIYLKRLID